MICLTAAVLAACDIGMKAVTHRQGDTVAHDGWYVTSTFDRGGDGACKKIRSVGGRNLWEDGLADQSFGREGRGRCCVRGRWKG
jgi:hypothetical protein